MLKVDSSYWKKRKGKGIGMRRGILRLCSQASAAATSGVAAVNSDAGAKSNDDGAAAAEALQARLRFERWLVSMHPTALDHVAINFSCVSGRSAKLRRGLVAKHDIQPKTVVASIPMYSLTLSAQSLASSLERHSLARQPTNTSPSTKKDDLTTTAETQARPADSHQDARENFKWCLPPFDKEAMKRFTSSRGIADPGVYPQIYLAMLLAAERIQVDSPVAPYLDVLPHPAIDDEAVMRLHKDMLDPTQLLEWDSHQHEFTSMARLLHRDWRHLLKHSAHPPPEQYLDMLVPPAQVLYWAIRTVFSRHVQMPVDGVTPQDAGSKLDMLTFDSVKERLTDTSPYTRLKTRIKQLLLPQTEQSVAFNKFQLEPMLVPLVDLVGHLAPANVAIDVRTRRGLGPCVELTAVDRIREGGEIGGPFNSCHSVAFTLYRFGFLPL